MEDASLSAAFASTSQAIAEATAWAGADKIRRKLAQDHMRIDRVLRRSGIEARRLERTFNKPTCVGVFGPSQAGKSYLISVLARKEGEETMIAKFDGPEPEIDFIKTINPFGGKEATGLVTRFTMHAEPTPPGFPVCLRLLSQSDLVKIIVNSYLQDGDQEYEPAIEAQALEAHLAAFEKRCAAQPLDALSEDDVWDVREYVIRNSGGASTVKAIEGAWDRIARIAPRLAHGLRAEFFSILWGRHRVFTEIFARLDDALAQLGFATDVFCELGSLIPSIDGILNVATLDRLLDPKAAPLNVRTAAGGPVQLPRPIITALAMELRIVCRDEPRPFFAFTDLLDFPGYRSRKKEHLERAFRDASNAAAEFYLRGKVDYLFQSYTADLELTSLILCLPDSNLEVTTLPRAVESWIDVTHGVAPDRRVGKPTLLFFALTKFDRHLSETAGDEGSQPALRFETRLEASLLGPFAKSETSWPQQWTPGAPFQNLFWIRNPNFKSEHVIRYEGRREVEVLPERAQRIAQLRAAFVGSPLSQRYFHEPARAWDEVMKLNDGGVSYLADALGVVSTRALKTRQVAARLQELRRGVVETLSPYYVEDDYVKRRAQRMEVVNAKVFPGLLPSARKMAFGSALRGLMVDATDLYATVSGALNRESEQSIRDPFGSVVQDSLDKWSNVANAVLDRWTSMMSERAENPAFIRRTGASSEALKELVVEFSNAARRAELGERIAAYIRHNNSPSEKTDAIARKLSLVAERTINRFVAQLDFDTLDDAGQKRDFGEDLARPAFAPRRIEYDTADMRPERRDFALEFMSDWAVAFRATVARTAMSGTAGVDDPALNAKLGEILAAMSG